MGLLKAEKRKGGDSTGLQVLFPAKAGEVLSFAVGELARGLGAMLNETVLVGSSYDVGSPQILVALGKLGKVPAPALQGDTYEVALGSSGILLKGGHERAVLQAVYHLLENLGARFPLGQPAKFPSVDRFRLLSASGFKFTPDFNRRALVSDIMTWHYSHGERFKLHLEHDRRFIPWMAQRGLNAFFYIRHAHDSRYRIDELVKLYRERGIASEYGGHIIQQLLPRDYFDSAPAYFPVDDAGSRLPKGNLCVSNHEALGLVKANALQYVTENPELDLFHIWGADVRGGAWCRCASCRSLSPQRQCLKVVNAIAEEISNSERATRKPKVAYLAYHDTLDPDPQLEPGPNVWFEWAPRERCYQHAIDDPACQTNPRYFESLKRYIDLFEGRGHIFEYYADAILFGGLGLATPATIASDLRAYHALGLRSISCLTFGAYSVLAYPLNLIAFAQCSRNIATQVDVTVADAAAQLHPKCAGHSVAAYEAIRKASGLVLNYGDVMLPFMTAEAAPRTRAQLAEASEQLKKAGEAADSILASTGDALAVAERELWGYSAETLSALAQYLGASALTGAEKVSEGHKAIENLRLAMARIRTIERELKGTWGAYDLEALHERWMEALGRRLADKP